VKAEELHKELQVEEKVRECAGYCRRGFVSTVFVGEATGVTVRDLLR